MSESRKKNNAKRYQATYELYKTRSRLYRQQNLDFVKVLEFYSKEWDGGGLAKITLQAFEDLCSKPQAYEIEYRNQFFANPPDKNKSP